MATARASRFEYEGLPGRVVFGIGAVGAIRAEIERLGCRRVLAIDGLVDPATSGRIAAQLGAAHIGTIDVIRQHVPTDLAEAARKQAATGVADCLLAVGGGSATGLAKAVALTTALPIVAVPTTYAGSEMTPIWGVTERGRKTTGRDARVLPRTVIYDPELTRTLPAQMSAASGMNAVAHCVEAMWTVASNPLTDAVATEAIALLAAGLRGVAKDPNDLEARTQTLRGAWLAGTTLAVAGTALHHKICHVLGGFGLPHAEVHAAVLPSVTEQFRAAAPEALRRTARALHVDDAVDGLHELAADIGVAIGLSELGLDAAAADRAAELTVPAAPAEPMPVTREQIRHILERAMGPSRSARSTRVGLSPSATRASTTP